MSAPFCRDHALALTEAGCEVFVVSVIPVSFRLILKTRKIFFKLQIKRDINLTEFVQCFPSIPKLRILNNYIRNKITIAIYRKKIKDYFLPDIIHVHGFLAGWAAFKLKQKYNIPYVITEHNTGFARNVFSRSQINLASKIFKNADFRIAVSEPFAVLLTIKFCVQFVFVPNVFNSCFNKNIKKLYNINDVIRICNVAHLDKKKNHLRLLKSFLNLKKNNYNVELHIVGNGPEYKKIKNFIYKKSLDKYVFLYGALPREDVFNLLKRSDIFALSSDYETFGVVLLEAMSFGLPVVSTKCGGPESIITNNSLGLLTELNDEDFYEGLRLVCNNFMSGFYHPLKIMEYVKNNFSYSSVGKRLLNIYKSIVK